MRNTLGLRLTLLVAIVATIGCDRITRNQREQRQPGAGGEYAGPQGG
jgi:hypothetical protein